MLKKIVISIVIIILILNTLPVFAEESNKEYFREEFKQLMEGINTYSGEEVPFELDTKVKNDDFITTIENLINGSNDYTCLVALQDLNELLKEEGYDIPEEILKTQVQQATIKYWDTIFKTGYVPSFSVYEGQSDNSFFGGNYDGMLSGGVDEMWWPFDLANVPEGVTLDQMLTSYFGPRKNPTGAGRQNHGGIDIAGYGVTGGTKILAAADGVVLDAGWNNGGFGNWVRIDHGGGLISIYGHGQNDSVQVQVGDKVTRGQFIMRVGTTGDSTGNHLHFELRLNGVKVDPELYLGKTYAEARPASIQGNNVDLLARLIYGEAGQGETITIQGDTYYADQIYVGAVVLNRVRTHHWLDANGNSTLESVIFAPNQYACTFPGKLGKNFRNPERNSKKFRDAERVAKLLLALYIKGEMNNVVGMPENVIYQAGFKQGSGIWKIVDNHHYYCYG